MRLEISDRGSAQTAPASDVRIATPAAQPALSIDSRAWLMWIAAALVPALMTLNPWYQLLAIGVVAVLWISLPHDVNQGQAGLSPAALVRIAAMTLTLGGLFYVLTVHYGDTVLVRIPDSVPLVGGPLTLQALAYGILNGLRLVSILCAFALFSRVVRYADLLRMAPAALFELGLMLSIGFTLVPFTVRAFNEIREAQSLRGYRPRGIRDLLPLFAPLVANGMEHALALAESMEARGYGGTAPGSLRQRRAGQPLALVSLFGLLVVLTLHTFAPLPPAVLIIALVVCVALLWLSVRTLSHASGRTRLHRGHWGLSETLVAAGALGCVLTVALANHASLVYDPYLMHGWPAFDPILGLGLLGLIVPALLGSKSAATPG